jgi:hypothetical protein
MLSIFRALTNRFKAIFATSAALELETEFVARQAERRAELLRQADRYEAEGLGGIARELRQHVEMLSLERPGASVLPALAHLGADVSVDEVTAIPVSASRESTPLLAAPRTEAPTRAKNKGVRS